MSYQLIPNITFILSVLGIILMILRRLPEAAAQPDEPQPQTPADQKLLAKGLPAEAISKVGSVVKFWSKKIANFALEAKDLRPHEAAGYKMKKIFGGKLPQPFKKPIAAPITTHEVKSEQYYLDMIKLQPKNYSHYDALGKFYIEQENYAEALDVYLYLSHHQSHNAEYHARLALCYYRTKQYDKAAAEYQKSLGLDSTQPNRYYNLGLSLEHSGKHTEAVAAITKALELEPTNDKYRKALEKVR